MKLPTKTIRLLPFITILLLAAILVLVAGYHLQGVHKDYWGSSGQEPQGTIYAVQTVEYNIANHGMPLLAAKALYNNDHELLANITNSAFGLTGFAVTRCGSDSTRETCLNEEVVSYTTLGLGWINNENVNSLIKNADYTALTNEHTQGVDWHYQAPKNDTRVDLAFDPAGDVIGRLYYVRRPAPMFNEQFLRFLQRPLTDGSDIKYYLPITAAYTLFFFLLSALVSFSYRKIQTISRVKSEIKTILAIRQDVEEQLDLEKNKNITLSSTLENAKNEIGKKEEEIQKLNTSYTAHAEREKSLLVELENIKNEVSNALTENDRLNELTQRKEKIEDHLRKSEAEKQQVWEELLKTEESLESLKSEVKNLKDDRAELTKEIEEKQNQIESLNHQLKINKKATKNSQRMVEAFISGLNTITNCKISLIEDVYTRDIPAIERSGINTISINNAIAKLAKVSLSDTSSAVHFEAIKGHKNLYHNKNSAIRIYFSITSKKSLTVIALWDQDHAPHDRSHRNWQTLARRVEKNNNAAT